MGARSYCLTCQCSLAFATMEEALSCKQECPHCGRINPANATPAEVFEAYKEDVESRLQHLEAKVQSLLQNPNA